MNYTAIFLTVTIVVLVVLALISGIFVVPRFSKSSKGEKVRRSHEHDTIVRRASAALARNTNDVKALRSLADLYFEEGDWSKALQSFIALSKIVPADGDDHTHFQDTVRHGISAFHCGEHHIARVAFKRAKAMPYNLFDLDYYLGKLKYEERDYAAAMHYLRRAATLDPLSSDTQRLLAFCYYHTREYKEALSRLSSTVHPGTEDNEAMFIYGSALLRVGEHNRAMSIFGNLQGEKEYAARASLAIGMIQEARRQFNKAFREYEEGLKQTSIDGDTKLELQYRLASLCLMQSDLDRGVPLLEEINATNPNYRDVARQIAQYRSFYQNKRLHAYLSTNEQNFVDLCKRLITQYYPGEIVINSIKVGQNNYIDLLTDIRTPLWREMILFRFMRTMGQTGELLLRELLEHMHEVRAESAVCFSAGNFTVEAENYAEPRTLKLVAGQDLSNMLNSL